MKQSSVPHDEGLFDVKTSYTLKSAHVFNNLHGDTQSQPEVKPAFMVNEVDVIEVNDDPTDKVQPQQYSDELTIKKTRKKWLPFLSYPRRLYTRNGDVKITHTRKPKNIISRLPETDHKYRVR